MNKYFTMSLMYFVRLLVFFIILISFSGCREETPIPLPTKKPCPTTIATNPESKGNTPKLIVVLVKEIPDYKEYAFQAFNSLLQTMPDFMEPGDRLVILSMEQYDLLSALILDKEVAILEKPVLLSSPTPPPTLGPLPPPTAEPIGDLMVAVATKDAEKYVKQTEVVATQTAYEYECAIEAWKSVSQDQWDEYTANRNKAISTFVSSVSRELSKNKKEGFQLSKNQAFEALQIAASFLNNECYSYERCSLLIFSDLDDPRHYRPENVSISLEGYEVATLMLHCTYKSQCEDRIKFWHENLSFYGASDPQFVVRRDVEDFLVSNLGR